MIVFLDTSSLVKRYVRETGTDRVIQICSLADDIVLSSITAVELISALSRRKREGVISKKDYLRLKKSFAIDLKGATNVEFYPAIVSNAINCIEKNDVRSLDAIQIASAIVAHVDLFVTSDIKQGKAAVRSGLEAEIV